MHDQQDRRMTGVPRSCRRYLVLALGPLLALATLAAAAAALPGLVGAGATFPAPLYQSWALDYHKVGGTIVRYDPVGSGAGIDRIEKGEVDFGGSDAPLPPERLEAAGLLQFPVVIGGVLPVINIRGIRPGELRLTGAVLADLYLGRVRRWDDPAIAALNAGLKLPHANVTVVHRQESSGSSLLFSSYLSASSAEWRGRVGAASTLTWPVGVGAKGNEGVATVVQRTRFAIGYVEYYFARAHGLSDVALRNHAGRFVRARPDNFSAAAQAAAWPEPGLAQQLPSDAPGDLSWPITGASFILIPRVARDADRERSVLKFFDWALHSDAGSVDRLNYAPVPQALLEQLPRLWQSARDSVGRPLWP
jgi:phosphate transport system substrate-binding protein